MSVNTNKGEEMARNEAAQPRPVDPAEAALILFLD